MIDLALKIHILTVQNETTLRYFLIGMIVFSLIVLVLLLFSFYRNYKLNKMKNHSIKSMETILNSLETMIYVTEPGTGEILFINDSMKQHYNIKGDAVGQLCYKILQEGFDHKCSFCPCLELDKDPDKPVVWEERSTLTKRIYRNNDRYIQWPDGHTVHMQHSVDTTELIFAREAAEKSNRYKTAFLANMSHEIRTPMNAILGIAEIQLQNKNLSLDTEEALGKIYESGDLLLNIINDILDLSKIEAGKLEIVPVKYDIPSLLNDTVQLNRLRYDSKPLVFTLNVDENTPIEYFGDELRIKQILNNILSNAFKYTDKGSIELFVSSESKSDDDVTIVMRISDTGQGMTQSQIDKLFDEYTRFNTEANRTTIGAGLGMSITKRLVDMMKGDISVQSEIDKGSVFTVRIPQKRIGANVCGSELVEKLRKFTFHNTTITKKAQFLREYMPYGSVLVVDDVESNIYVINGMLTPYGLTIETAMSGFEAIDKIKNGNVYDIIFMDHMMPKMDGIEATKTMRDMGYNHSIVALTANALIGRAEMFLRNGFDGFISKPIDSRELNQLLNDFIRNKKSPEIIEAARLEQRNKKLANNITKISELERFFVRDAGNAVKILEGMYPNLFNPEDSAIELFIVTVHGMKSALANIGETEYSNIANILEQAGRDKNFDVISNETPALIYALKSLIMKLKPAEDGEAFAPVPPSEEDKAYLREKLLSIKSACTVFNKKAAKTALNDLRCKEWPGSINTVLEKLSVLLLHSEFKETAETAENYLSGL